MIKLMRAGHMLLAGGKKPKIHLDVTPKKKNYSIMENFRKMKLSQVSIESQGA